MELLLLGLAILLCLVVLAALTDKIQWSAAIKYVVTIVILFIILVLVLETVRERI